MRLRILALASAASSVILLGPLGQPISVAVPVAAVTSGLDRALSEVTAGRALANSVAPSSYYLPEQILKDYRALFPGSPDSRFNEAARSELARAQIVHALSSDSAFAGDWYDFARGVWQVAATDDSVLSWATERAIEAGIPLTATRVRYTYDELMLVRASVQVALFKSGVSRYELSVQPEMNKVRLVLPSFALRSVPLQPDERLSVDAVESLPDPVPATCTSRWNCTSPLAGGVSISANANSSTSTNDACSTGFTALKARTGQRYVLTAGHCIHQTDVNVSRLYYQGSRLIGDARLSLETNSTPTSAPLDFALVGVNNSYWIPGAPGRLQTSLAATSAVDYRISSMSEISVGQTVCHIGIWFTSGYDNCGVVVNQNAEGRPQVAALKTCGGDSGGSVYRYFPATGQRWAFGLVSVTSPRSSPGPGTPDCTGPGNPEDQMSFSAIPFINNAMDAYTDYNIRVEVS